MNKIVAIHQPNFFPWLGYFDKIARSDVFIFLDDVQYSKTGGTWSNRVKMLQAGEPRWLTASIERNFRGTRLINQMQFSTNNEWRSKILNALALTYRHAPFFEETYALIEPLVLNSENNLAEYNIHAIKTLARSIGLTTDSMIRSSQYSTEFVSTQRLIDLTKKVGGNQYLCGGGADGYQEDDAFQKADIVLKYQEFHHPEYVQHTLKFFCGGLSIIDAFMNLGLQGVGNLFQKTIEK